MVIYCGFVACRRSHIGAKILVDMKSLLYLNGTELDYKEELMQSGFVFQNPNVKRACGCGTSFSI